LPIQTFELPDMIDQFYSKGLFSRSNEPCHSPSSASVSELQESNISSPSRQYSPPEPPSRAYDHGNESSNPDVPTQLVHNTPRLENVDGIENGSPEEDQGRQVSFYSGSRLGTAPSFAEAEDLMHSSQIARPSTQGSPEMVARQQLLRSRSEMRHSRTPYELMPAESTSLGIRSDYSDSYTASEYDNDHEYRRVSSVQAVSEESEREEERHMASRSVTKVFPGDTVLHRRSQSQNSPLHVQVDAAGRKGNELLRDWYRQDTSIPLGVPSYSPLSLRQSITAKSVAVRVPSAHRQQEVERLSKVKHTHVYQPPSSVPRRALDDLIVPSPRLQPPVASSRIEHVRTASERARDVLRERRADSCLEAPPTSPEPMRDRKLSADSPASMTQLPPALVSKLLESIQTPWQGDDHMSSAIENEVRSKARALNRLKPISGEPVGRDELLDRQYVQRALTSSMNLFEINRMKTGSPTAMKPSPYQGVRLEKLL
jgi:hypothetical protein